MFDEFKTKSVVFALAKEDDNGGVSMVMGRETKAERATKQHPRDDMTTTSLPTIIKCRVPV